MIEVCNQRDQIVVRTPQGSLRVDLQQAETLLEDLEQALEELREWEPDWRWYYDNDHFSERQKQFCQQLEQAGMGPHIIPYSGRGMYGAICPAIVTSDTIAEWEILAATKGNGFRDAMGLRTVIYFR